MTQDPASWLVGGGEVAKIIRAKDWSTTPLGPIDRWPQSLRTTVSLVQASSTPIAMAWGPGHTHLYNDGFLPICGEKHPMALGQDFRKCWESAFPVIGEAYRTAWSGRSAYVEKMRMFLDRHGFLEETWFTYSINPVIDESGRVGGVFNPITELTEHMLLERRTQTVRDIAIRGATARNREQALWLAADVLVDASFDVPFAVFYLVDELGTSARRIAHAGIAGDAAGPEIVDLERIGVPWELDDAFHAAETIELDDLARRLTGPVGPYPEAPTRALVLPIRRGLNPPLGLLVAGVSSRLPLNAAYREFYALLASVVGTTVSSAHAIETERRRADELAELDRAKTAFFSNVSHEFRTPLTLILGPLEHEIAESAALPVPRRERLGTMHRNGLRLLRLVNNLLDFSRVEAGRIRAVFEPVDLAVETAELAAVFRSAIEQVGLRLTVVCSPLSTPIYVDREMWEKIVLNLLSNALKYTPAGGITVVQEGDHERVTLRIIDSGTGIAAQELPRVFERFHRVHGAWSRSHEGTGIGLALVRDLARAHGGDVVIASTVGVGTIVTVTVKTGTAHLPADQVSRAADSMPRSNRVRDAFLQEALHWAPQVPLAESGAVPIRPADAPRVLWADDNADMRAYVTRLLSPHFDVISAADGAEALEIARVSPPDLVLSDVMMPELDGVGLLAALRGDPRTQSVPVILLSARAETETALVEGDAGADDYLTKPFAARELIARVRTHAALGRKRRAWAAELERVNAELEAFSYSVSHDLRAPLRSIASFTDILLEDDATDAPRRRELLELVRRSADRMGEIVDDLYSLSQVSTGELHRERVDVSTLARRIIADLQLRDPARIVEVRVDDGMSVVADRRLVRIALENLLGNAWKFTRKRSRAEIALDCETGGVFAVHDNGAGFDMAHSAHLFEPFQRLHGMDEFEGTGIGLAIVRRVVERHGGRAWAQGEVDRGATVRFTLDSQVVAVASGIPPRWRAATGTRAPGPGYDERDAVPVASSASDRRGP